MIANLLRVEGIAYHVVYYNDDRTVNETDNEQGMTGDEDET
jgi:hypothetical protein